MHCLLHYNRFSVYYSCFSARFLTLWRCLGIKQSNSIWNEVLLCFWTQLPQVLLGIFPVRLCALRNCQNIIQALSSISHKVLIWWPMWKMAGSLWFQQPWISCIEKNIGSSICGEFFVHFCLCSYILTLTTCTRSLNRKPVCSPSLDCFCLLALFVFEFELGLQ